MKHIHNTYRYCIYFAAAICIMVTHYGCSSDNAYTPPPPPPVVTLATSTTLGDYLVDKDGKTLYYFANDSASVSSCGATCSKRWPPFYDASIGTAPVGNGLTVTDFGKINGTNGKPQTTYKGRPLYYYAPAADSVVEARGSTAGDKVGNVWFVAKPDYTIMITNAQLVGADNKNYVFTNAFPTPAYTEGTGKSMYFTDDKGRTLYVFKTDKYNTTSCTSTNCMSTWPAYEVDKIVVPSFLDKSLFGSITLANGKKQMTYKGWPLYYYAGDGTTMGSTKGITIPATQPPGVWPVATKDLETAPSTNPLIKLATSATLGSYLVDKDGRSLYYFANDSVTVNTCVGGCASVWPIFFAGITPQLLGSGLDINDFDTIGTGAAMQLAYKGRPLYYYAPSSGGTNTPEAAGLTGGDGINGVWFVAKPDYTIMLTRAQLVGNDTKNYIFTITSPTPTYTEGIGKSTYFTDALGRTLYIFRTDKQNTTSCTNAGCMATWPIYEMDKFVVPSTLDKTLFGSITLSSGKKQMTYKGWPLYYYVGDNMKMGSTKGVSVPAPGVWPVATKDLAAAPVP